MNFKILILDDNHSFVDLLKMKLSKYPFIFDTAFRYEQANKQIKANKNIFSNNLIKEIKEATSSLEEWVNSNQIAPYPKLSKRLMQLTNIINEEGYFMIIIENKMEGLPKSISFIQNIISAYDDFQNDDFMVFTHNLNELNTKTSKQNIPFFLKDIRNKEIYNFIDAKVKKGHEKVIEVEKIFQEFDMLRKKLQNILMKKNKDC